VRAVAFEKSLILLRNRTKKQLYDVVQEFKNVIEQIYVSLNPAFSRKTHDFVNKIMYFFNKILLLSGTS
jgi:hypothetical protein